MKKHLKALLAGAAVAGSILACTAAYARFSDSVTVTNHISVGDINISLQELEKKDGREMKYQDRRIVLPGDEISKIPRITNHSEPCWVRVKISYTDDLEGLDGLDDRNLTGMSPRWIRKGEYFYYTRKLEQGDSVDIFTGVTVPSQWDESYQDKKLGITIVADDPGYGMYRTDRSGLWCGKSKRDPWERAGAYRSKMFRKYHQKCALCDHSQFRRLKGDSCRCDPWGGGRRCLTEYGSSFQSR